MIISIHQPNFLPYLGFFAKYLYCDVFVILDHVQYTKNGFQNRNKIYTAQGSKWITTPVKYNFGILTNEIQIDNNQKWKKQHISLIYQNYSKTKYFDELFPFLERIYAQSWDKLLDLNLELLKYAFNVLIPQKEIIYSSSLNIHSHGSKLILDICKTLEASIYFSGKSGASYLDLDSFKEENIRVIFQEYEHPKYSQLHGRFIPNLAFVDFIFNKGTEAFKKTCLS